MDRQRRDAADEAVPACVTDEPGLDPISGHPWGEETPAKRKITAVLLIIAGVVCIGWVLISPPAIDSRAAPLYLGGPGLILLGIARLAAESRSGAARKS